MQEHQIYTTIQMDSYLIHLRPSPQRCSRGKTVGGGYLVMPVSPGHVRRLHPYPPSRHRWR